MSTKEVQVLMEEHMRLAHTMQAGVAMEMNHKTGPTSPKHLRVGINTALRDHASLVGLLVEKGIITQEEYFTAAVKGMHEEVNKYEQELSDLLGIKVTLG